MDNIKQLNFLEVAEHFEKQETTGPSNKKVYMVGTSAYVEWITKDVLTLILEKNNIYEGIDAFLDNNNFQRRIDVVEVQCFRGELTADLSPIVSTAAILNNLYFLVDDNE